MDEKDYVAGLLGFCLLLVLSLYEALVFMQGWGWFVAPMGVVSLGYWQSFGVATMISTATSPPGSYRRWHSDDVTYQECIGEYLSGLIIVHVMLWLASMGV